jgi:hypothetical protein
MANYEISPTTGSNLMPIVSDRQLIDLIDFASKLPSDRITDVNLELCDTRKRAKVLTEVVDAAYKRTCPYYCSFTSIRWSKCWTEIHRWYRKFCDTTCTDRTATSIVDDHCSGLLLNAVQNMVRNASLSWGNALKI